MATNASNATSGQQAGRNGQKDRIPLTAEGFEALRKELHELVTVQRPQIADYIHEAKEGGDISESSAYEDAKNRQALLEGRIKELQYTLDNAVILDTPSHTGGKRVVQLGSTVEVETDRGVTKSFKLVSTVEADSTAKPQKVSNESPVGRALMGSGEGAKVQVTTPGGVVTYTVRSIS
jgi:transcription elongation factor GreA